MFLPLLCFLILALCADCSTSWYQTNKPLTVEQISDVFYKCTETQSVFTVRNDYTNVKIDVKVMNKYQIVTIDVAEHLPLLLRNKCNITLDFPQNACLGYIQDYLFNSINSKLYHLKKNLCNTNFPIIFTGNNIGGSLAYLIALDLMHSNLYVKQIVTFGALPPGNEHLIEWVCGVVKCINVRHKLDPMSFEGYDNFKFSGNVLQYESISNINMGRGLSTENDHSNDKVFGYMKC